MRSNHLQLRVGWPAATREHAVLDALSDNAQRLIAVLRLWHRRRRERRQLAQFVRLDARVLADIGLTRGGAEFLINKPFWRE